MLAGLHGGVEVDQEGAVGGNHSAAQQGTVRIAHLDRRTWLASATDDGTARADQHIGDGFWWGDIRSVELQGRRRVACRIDQAYVQCLAVGLGRGEGDAEGAVCAYGACADHGAGSVAHLHGSAWLTAPGEGDAIGQCQVGGLRGPHKIWRRHAGGW